MPNEKPETLSEAVSASKLESESKASLVPIYLWGGLFVIAMFAVPAISRYYEWGHAVTLVGILAVMLLIIPMARASMKYAKKTSGFISPAIKNYNKRIFIWMFSYAVLLIVSLWLFENYELSGALLYGVALLPALPMIYCIWAIGQYLSEETDEYVRLNHAKASLYATGFLLCIASLWGFLEQFDAVPFIPSWLAVPIWALGLGIGHGINKVQGA